MTRLSNLFFDIMVVAGVAAIRLEALEKYWGIMVILGGAGLAVSFVYNRIIVFFILKKYQFCI